MRPLMKNQFYMLFVPLILFSSVAPASGFRELKKTCKELAALRKNIVEAERKNAAMKRLMEDIGLHDESTDQIDAKILRLMQEHNALAKLCRSARTGSSTFVANLRGYEMLTFLTRLGEVTNGAGNLKH